MYRLVFLLILLCFSASVLAQNRSVSLDADPFLHYLGNAIDGDASAPTWQGPEGLQKGLDVGRYRIKQDDWIRYRLFLHYDISSDRISIPKLDNDLQVIDSQFVEDIEQSTSLAASMSIEWERRRGKRKLQGLLGRGIGISAAREHFDRSISNPLDSYSNDTLWSESGYSTGLMVYGFTGIQYSPIPELSLSARINGGFYVDYTPEEEFRVVVDYNTGAVLESMIASGESSSWGMGFYFRPRIMLSIYF